MMPLPPAAGTIIPIHAHPKSPRNVVEGWVADANGQQRLKLRITAPPEDGKANHAVLTLLSKAWNVPVSSLTIVSGETSRYKRILYNP